jgi:hypothetical protein
VLEQCDQLRHIAAALEPTHSGREERNDPDSREELLEALERIRLNLREKGRSDIEDIVLDVMDFVTGWSSPHMRV